MKVIVVGAGIIGASVAWNLARRGVRVTLVEAVLPASAASGRSFGWLNASFYLGTDHYRLRLAGMEAWARLERDLGGLDLRWPGCLWWEETGAAFDRVEGELAAFGYPCRRLTSDDVRRLEPALAKPPRDSLLLPGEGAVDLAQATGRLIDAALGLGADLCCGVPVLGVALRQGAVAGIRTAAGMLAADAVVVAAGTGSGGLLAEAGVTLPMLARPGLVLQTVPVRQVIGRILASPGQEVRQLADGALLAPASAHHQADPSESLAETPDALARATLDRLAEMVPAVAGDLRVARLLVAERPVPGDGLPVIGPCGPQGLYAAVMHSGATLGPLAGEIAAREIMEGAADASDLARFRPGRFA